MFHTLNDLRYVHRIVGEDTTHYDVQVPLFTCWGSTFARWSPVKQISKKYLDKKSSLMDAETSALYANIKKGDSTSVLFQ